MKRKWIENSPFGLGPIVIDRHLVETIYYTASFPSDFPSVVRHPSYWSDVYFSLPPALATMTSFTRQPTETQTGIVTGAVTYPYATQVSTTTTQSAATSSTQPSNMTTVYGALVGGAVVATALGIGIYSHRKKKHQ